MAEPGQKLDLTIQDGFDLKVIDDSRTAVGIFMDLQAMMEMQGLALLGDAKTRADKWLKQKSKLLLAIETRRFNDPKCIALVSRRTNESFWVHDIIPLLMISQYPYRKMMMDCIKDLAEDKNVKLIIPQVLHELQKAEEEDILPIETINEIFDKGYDKMAETGEKDVVVQHEKDTD